MAKKTAKQLRQELALLEKAEQNDSKQEELHTLTILKDDDLVDIEALPKTKLTAFDKAKIMSSLSQLSEIKDEVEKITNDKEMNQEDWFMLIIVFDEITTDTLGIVYNQKNISIPSLPNLDLLRIFILDNENWIGEKVNLFIKQLDLMSEKVKDEEESEK
ncbi:hypothetical protein [Enterococcus alishanensis]